MALLTNLKKDVHMVDGHSRSRYSRENGFFIWFENKSPERFVKMKDAMPNPLILADLQVIRRSLGCTT